MYSSLCFCLHEKLFINTYYSICHSAESYGALQGTWGKNIFKVSKTNNKYILRDHKKGLRHPEKVLRYLEKVLHYL